MAKHRVTLTAEGRAALQSPVAAGRVSTQKLAHARALLKAAAGDGGPTWADDRIAEAVEVSAAIVARVRRRFVERGLDAALDRKRQDKPSRERKIDGWGRPTSSSWPAPGSRRPRRPDAATAGRQAGRAAGRGRHQRRDAWSACPKNWPRMNTDEHRSEKCLF